MEHVVRSACHLAATAICGGPDVAYYDARRSGDMLSKISADTVVLSKAFFECSAAARSAISAVGGTGLLLYISPPLTALSLAVMPVVGVGAVLYGRYVKRLSKAAQAALGEAVGSAGERLSSIRTVKLCNGELREQETFDRQVKDVYVSSSAPPPSAGA
jgi:ABC-type multidrug transport system fused ATPase/permease subunit